MVSNQLVAYNYRSTAANYQRLDQVQPCDDVACNAKACEPYLFRLPPRTHNPITVILEQLCGMYAIRLRIHTYILKTRNKKSRKTSLFEGASSKINNVLFYHLPRKVYASMYGEEERYLLSDYSLGSLYNFTSRINFPKCLSSFKISVSISSDLVIILSR